MKKRTKTMKMIWATARHLIKLKFFTLKDRNRGAGEAFCMVTPLASAHSPL